jgi:S1-C subfamily serine protease
MVRLATSLAVLVAAATCAAPASAAPKDWRSAGNQICTDYYDDLAIFAGKQSEEDLTPALLVGMAKLTERKDARLTHVHPPAAKAATFASMLAHDRASARTLRRLARAIKHPNGRKIEKLLDSYQHDTFAYEKLARKLHLSACVGGGEDVVTGPAEELAVKADVVPVDPGAAALESQLQAAVAAAAPSIVQIRTTEGLGSGVVLDDQGDVVTNAHVVGDAKTAKVVLADGTKHDATVAGRFRAADVGVVKIKDARPPAATFADSSQLKLGSFVLALGSPLGLRGTVTQGIVSAVNRTEQESGSVVLGGLIQTSAPIFPGNSGGALVDLHGAVVGLPTLGADTTGIGFAVPSNTAVAIGRQLAATGSVAHSGLAWIGVLAAPVRGGGLRVLDVDKGGPAAKAGVVKGARLLAVDGRKVASTIAVKRILLAHHPGDTVTLTVRVGGSGKPRAVQVVLGELGG